MSSNIFRFLNRHSITFFACVTILLQGSDAQADKWCRLDDPAPFESKRREMGLSNEELDSIECPIIEKAKEMPEVLVLPMPCGRRMVFKRIDFPTAHILDHSTVFLGQSVSNAGSARRVVTDGPRVDVLTGSLSSGGASGAAIRSYYIGRYELTDLQYSVWKDGAMDIKDAKNSAPEKSCTQIKLASQAVVGTRVFPATELSWYDAVRFANDYTAWLVTLDRERIAAGKEPFLPWENASPATIRLPTEVEWEYAARAGRASKADLGNHTYEITTENGDVRQGDLMEVAYLVTHSTPSPNGTAVSFIGRKHPNFFGLYDTIGNVDEIVFDLFSMIRPDGKLGQNGGYTVRGGNAAQPKEVIGVASRVEVPFFNRDGPIRRDTTGVRLAVAGPAFTNKRDSNYRELLGNPGLDKKLAEARRQLLQTSGLAGGGSRESATDSLTELRSEAVEGGVSNRDLIGRLESIQRDLDKSTAALNQREKEVIAERLKSAVLLGIGLNFTGRTIWSSTINAESNLKSAEEEPTLCKNHMKLVDRYATGIRRAERISDEQFRQYVEIIMVLAQAPENYLNEAAESVKSSISRMNLGAEDLQSISRRVSEHVRSVSGNSASLKTRRWRNSIDFKLESRKQRVQQLLQHPWVDGKQKGSRPCTEN